MKIIEQLAVTSNIPKSKLLEAFGNKLEFNKSLLPFSSFNTGGAAKLFLEAATVDEIVRGIKSARKLKIPFFIIGGGSNLLISDNGYDGLIIKVGVMGLEMLSETEIESGAGEDFMDLVNFAADNSLSGIEFAGGIWGTVGGAVYGNAGAYGGEIKDIITEITLIDRTGNVKTVNPDYCRFGYRDSYLKTTGEIVIKAKFKLQKGDKVDIKRKVDEILAIRIAKHPQEGKSAGCFFKNIPDPKEKYGKLPAGKLLEEVGAKKLSVGGAAVYEKHANIIVNTGKASSKDIRELADILKKKVFDKFGIMLEEEIVQVGNF